MIVYLDNETVVHIGEWDQDTPIPDSWVESQAGIKTLEDGSRVIAE